MWLLSNGHEIFTNAQWGTVLGLVRCPFSKTDPPRGIITDKAENDTIMVDICFVSPQKVLKWEEVSNVVQCRETTLRRDREAGSVGDSDV